MASSQRAAAGVYRFGLYRLNVASRQLLKSGRELHVQEQPLRLLMFLLERPGEVCGREELREELWPTETFVEFDDGLNTAVQKIRQTLGDDARNPRFVETVPRRGYRFIAPVELDSGAPAHAAPAEPVIAPAPARNRWVWVAIGAILVASGVEWAVRRGPAGTAQPLKLSVVPPAGVELRPGIRGGSAISPDGRTVAFVAARNGRTMLWIRLLDSLDSRELAGTEGALLPFWSPDGKSLGFVAGGRLKRVELSGGPPQDLAAASRPTRGAWMDDGSILFAPGAGGPIFRVPASGGAATPVTPAHAGGTNWPYPISGTNRFLFFNNVPRSVDLATTAGAAAPVHLLAGGGTAVYAPPHGGHPGYLLWMQGTMLVGQAFDPPRAARQGGVLPVSEGVGFSDGWGFVDLSVSTNGVLLYGAGNTALSRLAWVKRDGSLIQTVSEPAWVRSVRLSADGRRALVERGIPRSVWMMDFERNLETRVTLEQEASGWAAWSPDGRQIAYSGERGGAMSLYVRDTAGTPERKAVESAYKDFMYDWSRDGRYLVYCEVNPVTKLDLWALPTFGGRKPFPVLNSPANEDTPRFSPDTRSIAYVSDESGRNEVYIRTFPDPGGKWQISTAGGSLPQWSGNGRELFYVAADGYLMSVPLKPGSRELNWSKPQRLFLTPTLGGPFEASPRGDRLLVLAQAEGSRRNELTVFVNWQSFIRR